SCSTSVQSFIKSSTLNCSGRKLNSSVALNSSERSNGFKLFRIVFLRCPNAVLTNLKYNFSSQPRLKPSFLFNRSTPESTFGGGLKSDGGTVNRYSAW